MKTEAESILQEADLILLESLVKSPVFSALKRCIEGYRRQCISVLSQSKDTAILFETQGRLIGMSVVETLPVMLVNQRKAELEKIAKLDALKSKVKRSKQS